MAGGWLGRGGPADWWSFKPLKQAPVPAGVNPIDHFIRKA